MPRPNVITETLRLDQCRPGDSIRVPHSPNRSWKDIGAVRLKRIKPLAKAGLVQIKYQSQWGRDPKVQKADVDGSIMVTRERLATTADGPDAGTPVPSTAEHDGVTYVATHGGDAAALVARAVAERPTVVAGSSGMDTARMLAALATRAPTLALYEPLLRTAGLDGEDAAEGFLTAMLDRTIAGIR